MINVNNSKITCRASEFDPYLWGEIGHCRPSNNNLGFPAAPPGRWNRRSRRPRQWPRDRHPFCWV